MGIDIDSKLLVGLQYEDFPEELIDYIEETYDGNINEWAEEEELESASPWYDAGSDQCFYGFDIINCGFVPTVITQMQNAAHKFEQRFKCKPKVYGGCHVW